MKDVFRKTKGFFAKLRYAIKDKLWDLEYDLECAIVDFLEPVDRFIKMEEKRKEAGKMTRLDTAVLVVCMLAFIVDILQVITMCR